MSVPLRVLWGEHGVIQRCFKPLELWSAVAKDVSGGTVPCGHYVPEEAPEALLTEMRAFFA